MSVSLRPEPKVAPLVPLATGLAVVHTLRSEFLPFDDALEVGLKWPNDVVVVGPNGEVKKLAGILAEATATPAGLAVVVGMGLNLDLGPTWANDVSAEVAARSVDLTTLVGADRCPERDELATMILRSLSDHLKSLDFDARSLVDRYREVCVTLGTSVDLEHPAGPVSGLVVGIDDSGAIVLETSTGVRSFNAGEVHTRRAP